MYDMLSFLLQADLLSRAFLKIFVTEPYSYIHDFPSRCCYDRSHADHSLSVLLLLSICSVFKARISLVWRQFPLEQDEVTGRRVGVACLVNFLDSPTGSQEKISQNDA